MYAAADRLFVRNLDDNQPAAHGGDNTIDQIIKAEYNSWLNRGTGLELEDVCAYWSLPAAQAQWPTIFNIAMDYLQTQAMA
ncbi:hypothetical protein EVJ58_g5810 [Rhodofomes roseus]|uniref:Uncharacterized protein n=1 Tax=Rhodofomes roseus TaxID=34475 RepID=A0A4Y9YCB8_9APHY|nr:hypothetical protein EVJ58_g5810 [Rhodofomes roseus]